MYTFSRSAQQGTGNLSQKQTELAIVDIINHTQKMERSVSRTMLKGISEEQLSFENILVAGYANANCTVPKCRVFDPAGGALSWGSPSPGANDGSNWIVTGSNAIPDIGDDTAADLVLLLPGLNQETCVRINEKLNVTNPGGIPPPDNDGISTALFTGTFANTERIGTNGDLGGVTSACVANTQPNPDEYIFYKVLLER